jgi:hypothetical protein
MLVVPSKKLIAISQMVQDIERDEEQFQFTENDDVFSISNILKQCTCLAPTQWRCCTSLNVIQTYVNCPIQSSPSHIPNESNTPKTGVGVSWV